MAFFYVDMYMVRYSIIVIYNNSHILLQRKNIHILTARYHVTFLKLKYVVSPSIN